MSELRDISEALIAVDQQLDKHSEQFKLQAKINENYSVNFESISADLRFLKSYLVILQDQIVAGFSKLGAGLERKEPPDGRH
jgi:hypothetical protein